jgi:hypothetical protein
MSGCYNHPAKPSGYSLYATVSGHHGSAEEEIPLHRLLPRPPIAECHISHVSELRRCLSRVPKCDLMRRGPACHERPPTARLSSRRCRPPPRFASEEVERERRPLHWGDRSRLQRRGGGNHGVCGLVPETGHDHQMMEPR